MSWFVSKNSLATVPSSSLAATLKPNSTHTLPQRMRKAPAGERQLTKLLAAAHWPPSAVPQRSPVGRLSQRRHRRRSRNAHGPIPRRRQRPTRATIAKDRARCHGHRRRERCSFRREFCETLSLPQTIRANCIIHLTT